MNWIRGKTIGYFILSYYLVLGICASDVKDYGGKMFQSEYKIDNFVEDKTNGVLYVSAGNSILQLNNNLDIVVNVTYQGNSTGLVIDYTYDRLLVCSDFQPCNYHFLNNINETDEFIRDKDVEDYQLPGNLKFVLSQRASGSLTQLHVSRRGKTFKRQIEFSYDSTFLHFYLYQKYGESNSNRANKTAMYYEYMDEGSHGPLLLQCTVGGQNFDTLRAIFVAKLDYHMSKDLNIMGVDFIWFMVFSKNESLHGTYREKSTLCMFNIQNHQKTHTEEILLPDYKVEGMVTYSELITSVVVTRVENQTMAFLGTSNGHVKKVRLTPRSKKLDDITVNEGSGIQSMEIDKSKTYLYIVTDRTITRMGMAGAMATEHSDIDKSKWNTSWKTIAIIIGITLIAIIIVIAMIIIYKFKLAKSKSSRQMLVHDYYNEHNELQLLNFIDS